MPDMIYVDSSNVEAVGYDDTAEELHVQFLSGDAYVYHGVPREVFDGMLHASSKGSYLNREIKGTYQYTKR